MFAGVEPVMSACEDADERVAVRRQARVLDRRLLRAGEVLEADRDRRGLRAASTICVNRPLSTESALTIAPGHSESEFAAYATMRSYWRVSLRFSVVHE